MSSHICREKPYGTIVEGSVGYQEDSHHASQVLLIDDSNKKFDEKSLLIPNGKSTEMLTPFSGTSLSISVWVLETHIKSWQTRIFRYFADY